MEINKSKYIKELILLDINQLKKELIKISSFFDNVKSS